MSMIRWNPVNDHAIRNLNHMMNDFFNEEGNEEVHVWSPRMDIVEANDNYTIFADIPGLNKDNIAITLEDGVLTISGDRALREKGKDETIRLYERAFGKFSRSFRIRENIDVSKIGAEFKNGVLSVKLPKAEAAKPKKIEIKAA